MTSLGLSYTSVVITFDQNWHHLHSTSAGGKDLSNDAQIRVISLIELENSEQNFLPLHLATLFEKLSVLKTLS